MLCQPGPGGNVFLKTVFQRLPLGGGGYQAAHYRVRKVYRHTVLNGYNGIAYHAAVPVPQLRNHLTVEDIAICVLFRFRNRRFFRQLVVTGGPAAVCVNFRVFRGCGMYGGGRSRFRGFHMVSGNASLVVTGVGGFFLCYRPIRGGDASCIGGITAGGLHRDVGYGTVLFGTAVAGDPNRCSAVLAADPFRNA